MAGSTTGRLRLLAGFALAPLAIPLLIAILIWRSCGSAAGSGKLVILMATLFAYPSALLAAVPSYLLLRVRGWMHAWHFALAGLITEAAEDIILEAYSAHAPPWHFPSLPRSGDILVSAFLGTSAALVFWLIAIAGTGGSESADRSTGAP